MSKPPAKEEKTLPGERGDRQEIAIDFRQVLESLPDGITIQDREFNIVYQNKAMRGQFGVHLGAKCYAVYEKRDQICEGCGVAKAFETRQPLLVLRTATDLQGRAMAMENSCFPIFDEHGAIRAGAEVCRNVTNRVGLENEVRERNIELGRLTTALRRQTEDLNVALNERDAAVARNRTVLASIGDGLIVGDVRGCVELMNPVAEQLTGWSAEEAGGRPVDDVFNIVNAETRAPAESPVTRALEQGIVVGLANHTTLISRDGIGRQIADSCAPVRDDRSQILGVVLVFRDVTDEYRRLEQLRQSEERFRTIFDSAREGILVVDERTKALVFSNRRWNDLFGYSPEELPRLCVADLCAADTLPGVIVPFDALAGCQKDWPEQHACRRKDGSAFFADILSITVTLEGKRCIVVFFTDTSERKQYEKELDSERIMREKAEIELRHAQKLQAVGQLAAGIAHEINTPTQFVGDSVQFLAAAFADGSRWIADCRQALAALTRSPEHEALRKKIGDAERDTDLDYILENAPAALQRAADGIARISAIVRAMKEFAHPDQREKSPADLNRALETTLTIAKNEYKYVADIETEYGELPLVLCHLGDLNQVFLNLLVNAAHAVCDVVVNSAARGRIGVRTAHDGGEVRVEIWDTGTGIPEEIRDRVFEPFFTTKKVGRGSGQGLAIARSIVVDKHGGSLTFRSKIGEGTTFIVRLPVDGKTGTPSSTL